MAENSGISWTDHTFNPWIGCTNAGPGCDHCYAEKLATTRLGVGWGNDAPRRRTQPGNWAKVRKWHRDADSFKAGFGRYPRVFAASLADIFDNKVDPTWRQDFFELVKETPKLQWLIVTKRIGNVVKMLPPDWGTGYPNVVLISTVVNQDEADRDIPKLLTTPAARRGLSIEPMLGPMDIAKYLWPACAHWPASFGSFEAAKAAGAVKYKPQGLVAAGRVFVDWVITGGESKQLVGARPLVDLEADWVRGIAAQCEAAGVPHHFKQWGHTIPAMQVQDGYPGMVIGNPEDRIVWREDRASGKDMGRMLDGVEHNGFPVQQP